MFKETFRRILGTMNGESSLASCGAVLFQQKIFRFSGYCGGWIFSEALLRWHHPLCGIILPLRVLPQEDKDFMCLLTRFVLNEACRLIARENMQGDFHVAVNVPAFFFEDENVVDEIYTILRRSGVPTDRLILEITERYPFSEKGFSVAEEVSSRGIRVAIDGFGEAFSSLEYLFNDVFSIVKIDKDLFWRAYESKRKKMFCRILSMLVDGGYEIVVEGVEHPQHEMFLAECLQGVASGSFYVQGFMYHKPEVW